MSKTTAKAAKRKTAAPKTPATRRNQKPRPLSKRDIDRWVKWWDWEKPDSTIDPRLRTVDKGIAGLLINNYDGKYGGKEIDRLPWSTIATLAAKAEGSSGAYAKQRSVWAGIVADWAFHCAAPAWLALLPKGASVRYDSGLLPCEPCWWSAHLIHNMERIVGIMGDLERSMRATTQARATLLQAVNHQLWEVLAVGHDALAFVLDRTGGDDLLPRWTYLSRPFLGETDPARIAVAKRVAATLPGMFELVVTTRAGDALEYVRDRCDQWPDLTVPAKPAKPKGRKAA